MNRWAPCKNTILPFAIVAAVVFVVSSPSSPGAGPDDPWEKYRVLVQRNIFLRDRRPVRAPGNASTQPAMHDSDRDVVLTGVARRSGTFVAFFENTRTHATSRIRAGQAVGKGKIKAITLDGVTYERGDRVRTVAVGRSLAGVRSAPVTGRTATSAPTKPSDPPGPRGEPTTAPAAPTANPGADASDAKDILEQMRRRRQRELRK